MRPASFRTSASPFVKRREKPGAQKLGIDWDKFEFSNNHNLNTELNLSTLSNLRIELHQAELIGRHSKAKKLRREINRITEDQLAIGATWCGGCLNYLQNCRCPRLDKI